MAKKYKIDFDDEDCAGNLAKLLESVANVVGEFDFGEYADDDLRIGVFTNAGNILKAIFNDKNQSVVVKKDSDTIGGEITISANDIVLSGESLELFVRCLRSANGVEFTSFNDGHTDIGLIYTDLMAKTRDEYAN